MKENLKRFHLEAHKTSFHKFVCTEASQNWMMDSVCDRKRPSKRTVHTKKKELRPSIMVREVSPHKSLRCFAQ
jgi:hypothetical protein